MKKKDYLKPTVQVVKLQQQGILCGSGETGVQNYEWNEEVTE